MVYTDSQINQWMQVRKVLPPNWYATIWRQKTLYVWGDDNNRYRIIINDDFSYSLSFSVILLVYHVDTNEKTRLRRYDFHDTEHTNRLEGNSVYGYHIHKATERYQRNGYRIDDYAESTNRFSNIPGAIKCLIQDANFQGVP